MTLTSTPAIASFWLAHQLPDFQCRHPDISIRMLIVEDLGRLILGEFDLGLYYHLLEEIDPDGLIAEPVFDGERVAALCSPAYLVREGRIDNVEEMLTCHTLLVVERLVDLARLVRNAGQAVA